MQTELTRHDVVMYVCIYVCMYVCMYMCIYVYIYMYVCVCFFFEQTRIDGVDKIKSMLQKKWDGTTGPIKMRNVGFRQE